MISAHTTVKELGGIRGKVLRVYYDRVYFARAGNGLRIAYSRLVNEWWSD
jgi:hypothetical protein